MGKFKDLSGLRFGRLVVLNDYMKKPRNPRGDRIYWHCRCDCGNECYEATDQLTRGRAKSCGCLKHEIYPQHITHNMTGSRLYSVWNSMKQRCFCITAQSYKNYGARGITVCNEWLDFERFYNWAINNGYDENAERGLYTIERIDVNGNYEPGNCKWVTAKEQVRNRRCTFKCIVNGEEKPLGEWCEIFNAPYKRTRKRIYDGWDVIEALTKA